MPAAPTILMKLCHLNGCVQIVRSDSLETVNLVIIFEPLSQLRRASAAKTCDVWLIGAWGATKLA